MRRQFGGSWTEAKLALVSKYLSAYTTALRYTPFEKVYVDAFAGTGYRELKAPGSSALLVPELSEDEPVTFLKGSALRALETQPPFDRFVFIERDPVRYGELHYLVHHHYADRQVDVLNQDANIYLQGIGDEMGPRTRAVVFLDPFGMEVTWESVEAIARTRKIDLWYLFPAGAVMRLMARDGAVPAEWRRRLDQLFGSSEWYDVFYSTRHEPTLFGEEELTVRHAGLTAVAEFLVRRLKTVFPAVAENPLDLRNSRGAPLFLLAFAAEQRVALKIATWILGKGAKGG